MSIPLVAVDPGEEHVGLAFFDVLPSGSEIVKEAFTTTHFGAIDLLKNAIEVRLMRQIVAEQWRVYPGMSNWSECRTAEVIGVLRNLCRWHDMPFATLPARVKKPAMGYINRTRTELKGDTVHARDAELIGWAWVNGVRLT